MRALDDCNVMVVGTGLMGTSLALALRGRVKSLQGVDADPQARAGAAPAFDGMFEDLTAALAAAPPDILVLAAPVRAILSILDSLASLQVGGLPRGCLVLDLGSVKAPILAAMGRLPESVLAVGGHPMCGRELNGPQAADPTLYRGCVFVLCPSQRTTENAIERSRELIVCIGATPFPMDAVQHDRAVAAISHLPYLLSAGLVASVADLVAQSGDDALWKLASTGFRDTSRLASSDVTMMGDTVWHNREAIGAALDMLQLQIATLRQLVAGEDAAALRSWLSAARQARQDWLNMRGLA